MMKRLLNLLLLLGLVLTGCSASKPASQQLNESLFRAASFGDAAQVKALCGEGADPNAVYKGTEDLAPLHIAAQQGNDGPVQALLACGANVNLVSAKSQSTPLILAAWRGQATTVKLLLANGADPKLKDAKGRTALDHALAMQKLPLQVRNPDQKFIETVRLLRQAAG